MAPALRYLLQFKIINHFKPLLDAFQGSYKDKYYYWVAVHIMLRSIFFALYGLQIKIRLIIATVVFTGWHGYSHPNKNKLVNIQELKGIDKENYVCHHMIYDENFCLVKNVLGCYILKVLYFEIKFHPKILHFCTLYISKAVASHVATFFETLVNPIINHNLHAADG